MLACVAVVVVADVSSFVFLFGMMRKDRILEFVAKEGLNFAKASRIFLRCNSSLLSASEDVVVVITVGGGGRGAGVVVAVLSSPLCSFLGLVRPLTLTLGVTILWLVLVVVF